MPLKFGHVYNLIGLLHAMVPGGWEAHGAGYPATPDHDHDRAKRAAKRARAANGPVCVTSDSDTASSDESSDAEDSATEDHISVPMSDDEATEPYYESPVPSPARPGAASPSPPPTPEQWQNAPGRDGVGDDHRTGFIPSMSSLEAMASEASKPSARHKRRATSSARRSPSSMS